MANFQRTWLVVCFLLCEILTGSDSSLSRREGAPHGSQDPSLQALSNLLGQLPAQDLSGSATDLARLMDSVSRAVGQGAQGPTGVGRSVGQGAQGPTGVGGSVGQGVGRSVGQGAQGPTGVGGSVRQGAQGPTGVGQGVGRSLDVSSMMEMANALQQNPEARALFRGSDGAMMEVFVETRSLDDLTRSQAGRRQLGQLNQQLEQAAGSLRQGVAMMMQSVPRAQHALTTPGDLQATLRDIAAVFSPSGAASNDSNDTMAAVTRQLLQTVEGLPALKGVLHNVYNVLAGLQTRQPSTARDLQQVLASLTSSLQTVLGGGRSLQGADSVQRVMQMAVSSLQHGMELLNSALLTAHVTLGDGALLQTLNDTRCLLTTLTRPHPDTRLALRCMHSLLLTALSAHNADQIVTSTSQFLATFLNDPTLLQSAVTLLQSPSLDAALSMMQTVMTQLNLADKDVSTAMQTAHAMLTRLMHNQQLLQALAGLLRSPESAALYGEVVEMLRNATVGDPLWQQAVVVVNDTLVALWTAGDAGQAVDTLRHVLTVLSHTDHPALPLSPTQRAFINMLHSLLDVMLNATTTTTTTTLPEATTTTTPATPSPTPTPPVTATAPPTSTTTTTATTTKTTTTTTARPATTPPPVQTTSTSRPEPSSPAPATTRRSDTVDDVGDNGGAHVSFSAFSVALGVLVSAAFL